MPKKSTTIRKVADCILVFLLAGACLLAFFVILCGARTTGVLNNFYWLKANTSGIPNAPDETFWLNYMFCSKASGMSNYQNCSGKQAAYPFSPKNNFKTVVNVPASFVNSRDKYYYLSRVGWAMWLVGLFFLTLCLISSAVTLFLSDRKVYITSTILVWSAWFYLTLSACLWTAAFVMGKNAFTDSGRSAHLGVKMFAFIWTTVFILSLGAIWQPISAFLAKKHKNSIGNPNNEFVNDEYSRAINNNDLENTRGALADNNSVTDSDSYINNPTGAEYSNFNNPGTNLNTATGATENETAGILNVPFQNKTAKGENQALKSSVQQESFNSAIAGESESPIINAPGVSKTVVV